MGKGVAASLLLFACFFIPGTESRSESSRTYEVCGTLLDSTGRPFTGVNPFVQLSGPYGPVDFSTSADAGGSYKIKKVPAGIYLLTAFVPRVARIKRTIEVGPSFADKKGRVEASFRLESRPRRPGGYQVSAEQLAIPDKARGEFEKGRQRMQARDLSRAAEHFRKAVDLAPQFASAWYNLGVIASHQKRLPEAAEHYRRTLHYTPENYQALLSLGSVLLAQNLAAEAIPPNEQAVKARADDPQAQAQLAYSYFLTGRLQEAEVHFRKTISLDPANYHYPQIFLAQICQQRQDAAGMVRELEEFVRLHPDSEKAREVARMLEELRPQARLVAGKP